MSLRKRSVSSSCVDSRSEDPILGTPGGDFSVLAEGVAVYLQLTGESNFTDDAALDLFKAFMDTIKGKKRKVGRGAGPRLGLRRRPRLLRRRRPAPLLPKRRLPAQDAGAGLPHAHAPAPPQPPAPPPLAPTPPAHRQFYFHTSDEKRRDSVFKDVNAATGKNYVTLPDK
jgi:hypothetical protein